MSLQSMSPTSKEGSSILPARTLAGLSMLQHPPLCHKRNHLLGRPGRLLVCQCCSTVLGPRAKASPSTVQVQETEMDQGTAKAAVERLREARATDAEKQRQRYVFHL